MPPVRLKALPGRHPVFGTAHLPSYAEDPASERPELSTAFLLTTVAGLGLVVVLVAVGLLTRLLLG